jgi:predicted dithiol-disulfide oxidoreductase (DUF899 family)
MTQQMTDRRIGTRDEWLAARERLLVREKEHTRLGDELAQLRRELPWVRVEKEYRFDTDEGEKPLVELFDGRSQLLVYHFMFGPNYEAGCPTCSSMADGIDGLLPHLHARDVTFAFVSQAPLEKLQAYKRRMGWGIPWVSTARTDFNFDLGFSSSQGQTREWVEPMAEQLPPIAANNARSTGTDLVGYLTELFGFSSFVRDDGTVYPHLLDDGPRSGVSDGLLPDPRPRTEGPRRGRTVAALDPPVRRVRKRVTPAAMLTPASDGPLPAAGRERAAGRRRRCPVPPPRG